MSVTLPRGAPLGALPLRAWTRRAGEPAAVLRDVLVVKAAYDLLDRSDGVRALVPVADPDRAAPRVGDEGTTVRDADGVPVAFSLTRETETAPEKALADVVVEGHRRGVAGGRVDVEGSVWLRRAAGAPPDDDADRNLFGYQPRGAEPRALEMPPDPPPPPDPALHGLPPDYTPAFHNVHRRGGAFTATPAATLPSGGLVEVFATAAATDEAVAVRLPELSLRARLRAYCGHGPDEPPRWQVVAVVEPLPDTLVLAPDAGTASVVWRASWETDLVPRERWRAVQVLPGGAATAPAAAGGGG